MLARAREEQLALDLAALAEPGALGSRALLALGEGEAVRMALPPQLLGELEKVRGRVDAGGMMLGTGGGAGGDGVGRGNDSQEEKEEEEEETRTVTGGSGRSKTKMVVLRVAGKPVVVKRP